MPVKFLDFIGAASIAAQDIDCRFLYVKN